MTDFDIVLPTHKPFQWISIDNLHILERMITWSTLLRYSFRLAENEHLWESIANAVNEHA